MIIEIATSEMNAALEGEVIKAVQKVGVAVDKDELVRALKAVEFVDELIEYIFDEYPEDDYMTTECLCRKLHKHGLIGKFGMFYEPKDELQKWEAPPKREAPTVNTTCIVVPAASVDKPQTDFWHSVSREDWLKAHGLQEEGSEE